MAPLALALAWLLSLPSSADQVASADGSFTVDAPAGWQGQTPKSGYILQLAPPGGKGGFTMAPAEGIHGEADAQSTLQTTASQVGTKLRIQFGKMRQLDTPQPGRMFFVSGTLGGKEYLLGYHTVMNRWYRVDVLSDGATDAANAILTSLSPPKAAAAPAPKLSGDFTGSEDGRFYLSTPKGWQAQPGQKQNEIVLKDQGGDILRIASDDSLTDPDAWPKRLDDLTDQAAGTWKVSFSPLRDYEVGDHPIKYKAGTEEGGFEETALVGVFRTRTSFFDIWIQAKSTRPLDVASKALELFRLKGDEAPGAAGGRAGGMKPAGPAQPTEVAGSQVRSPKSGGKSESYGIPLMLIMAAIPVGGLIMYATATYRKREPPPPPTTTPPTTNPPS